MAQQRSRTPPRKVESHLVSRYGVVARRTYTLRHSPKRAQLKGPLSSHAVHVSDASLASRPVLVPLHINLRRLPSRPHLMAPVRTRDAASNASSDVQVGSKRKRLGGANENIHIHTRGSRATGKFKRQRSQNDSSEEELVSNHSMDVDDAVQAPQNWSSDLSDEDEALLDDPDEYLIYQADSRELQRLRKDELARLCSLAGLTTSTEDLTKSELISSIISSRVDEEDVPPSSPPGKTDGGYSTDEGHDGGGEETDAVHMSSKGPLRRRSTVQEIGRTVKRTAAALGRSLSLTTNNGSQKSNQQKKCISKDVKNPSHPALLNGSSRRRRTTSNQSSPQGSIVSYSLPSPPATRLRSRTISADSHDSSSLATSPVKNASGSGASRQVRAKHVEFRDNGDMRAGHEELLSSQCSISNPSPRRLRSKGSKRLDSVASQESIAEAEGFTKRVIPMRKAKGRIGSLKEDSTATESDCDESGGNAVDDEVDELDSSPSPLGSPEPRQTRRKEQRTPMKRRLRSRRLQTHTPPSDGDDEEEEEEEGEEEIEQDNEEEEDSGVEESKGGASVSIDGSEEEEQIEKGEENVVEPRILRNGKIVGEDIAIEGSSEEGSEEVEEQSGSEIDIDQESETGEGEDVEADEEMPDEDEDEVMEDEFDLTSATQKTLVRLRRDDLVRLCEARELDVEGTKPQLAQALLEWRDSQENMTPCPSSTSTARPPSVMKANGRRRRTRSDSKSSSATPPVLLRSDRIHEDEPVTPPLSKDKKEEDLELDLETLGLEDREIPPDKLTKLEKIGSGGFKDVFIGKFKGRRVAIAEFRDQLSPMDIKELKLLAEFAHPNIVRFLGVSIPENTKETPVMIVSELCANGDLFDYVRNVAAPSLYKVLSLMLDIARGLEYLHNRKPSVIHRDCKSSNILITSKGTAKIADFGLAKVKQSTRSMVRSLVGTVNWQAPELWVAHPKYNHKVDVYSCACVYWEILQWHNPNIKFPWEGMNEHAIYEIVGQKRQRPSLSGLRKLWCPDIVDLIERMWAHDPQQRPTVTEVVEELQRIAKEYR